MGFLDRNLPFPECLYWLLTTLVRYWGAINCTEWMVKLAFGGD